MTSTGLSTIADASGRFAVLAMDQRATLRRMLTGAGQPAEDDDLRTFKIDVIGALSPLSSGVLLDADYGIDAVRRAGALADGVGLLVAAEPAEKQKYQGEYRTLADPNQDAAWVREQGGDAMKFLVYWDPDRPAVAGEPDLSGEAMATVAGIVADCASVGLPSVIEPLVTFGPNAAPVDTAAKEAAVIRSAARLATLSPSMLKLEWPGDADGCRRVSQALARVPWTLLSAGVEYEQFVERVRIALEAGASGFIAGRAIWGEAVAVRGVERKAFLNEVAVPRLAGLVGVLADHGRPWPHVVAS